MVRSVELTPAETGYNLNRAELSALCCFRAERKCKMAHQDFGGVLKKKLMNIL
jgi:hypothetical protein